MMIFEWMSEEAATTDMAVINGQMMAYFISNGYTFNGSEIVGKNAATGEDEPLKTGTACWGLSQLSPDNTYYVKSPTRRDWFVPFVGTYTEKEYPTEWDV